MINYRAGDIIGEQADVLVNTVNCVGVMGKGVALQFKKTFPDNYKAYKIACDRKDVIPGQIFVYETGLFCPRFIFNFPTKRHWRGKSKIEDIDSGMKNLVSEARRLNITSIAIPPLGSGLGGLEWSDVLPIIKKHLSDLKDVDVIIFEPSKQRDRQAIARNIEVPEMTAGRAALIVLMDRYLSGFLDPFISLLEMQKLMYFLQVAGEPLKLQFEKGEYGPYAQNLSPVLHALEGHYIENYGTGGNHPDKPLALIAGALNDANNVITSHPKTEKNIYKVFDLIEGFESSYGLELLATTHWVAQENQTSDFKHLVDSFYDWNAGKKRFTETQIRKAYDVLAEKGW